MEPGGTDPVFGDGEAVQTVLPEHQHQPEPLVELPRKLPKWPFVLAGFLLAIGVGLAILWPIDVPYYALSPGPVNDVSDYISVPDDEHLETGELFFLTVSLREVNVLEYIGALLDGQVDLSPRENIRPAGVSTEDLRRRNLDLMEQSKRNAMFIALTQLGYEVTFEGSGALVLSTVEDSAAVGVLQENDVIVAVNGEPVEFSTDAVEKIGGKLPGDVVVLEVRRPTDESGTEFDEFQVEITLGPFRELDEDSGEVTEDPNRGMVGVLLANADVEVIFPVEIEIDSQNIGGPSAGMMFTLEIMNQLTEDDITKGHRIAGTGTIDEEGNIGAIGGVRQKVFAAIDAGAEYVLVPANNFEDAADAGGDDIEVVSIATIDDAVSFLDTL